ncbi:MAG: class I SAM-dependent methyltransferase [Bacteroidota bacterium]
MEQKKMETLDKCPVCDNEQIDDFLHLKDWFLSKEDFTIGQCNNCGFLLTNPRPSPDELGKYYKSEEYISHSNTNKGFINGIYKFVRAYTIKQKYQIIKVYKPGSKILDIGSGTGEFLNFCKHSKWEVQGIEPDEDARNFSIQEYGLPVNEEEYLQDLQDESFDVITMWHVLEHVPDLNERMQTIYRLLKNKGIIVIAVPNPESYDAKYYGEHWAAYDVPRHLYHFKQKDIQKLAAKHNFHVKDVYPMKFDAFYVSMLSEKYKNGKVNYWNAIRKGIKSNFKAAKNTNYSSVIYILGKDGQNLK